MDENTSGSHRSVMTLATFIAFVYKCLAEECLVAQPQKQSKQMVRIRNNRPGSIWEFHVIPSE